MIGARLPVAEPTPRRARQLIPAGLPRRGELIAASAVAVAGVHLLLAQLTLILAVTFAGLSWATRWRLSWLLVPAAAGITWVLLAGPGPALAGFAAGPASVLRHLGLGAVPDSGRPAGVLSGIGNWLPQQLPVALPLAAAEAAVAGWLGWLHTDEWALRPPRPGAVAAVRTAAAARRIASGAVLTRAGCILGVVPATGAAAGLSWTEISRGVLVTGSDERAVTLASLQVVHAALRRRKPVFVLGDGSGGPVAAALAAACAATGTPLTGERDAVQRTGSAAAPPAASASRLWGRGAVAAAERQAAERQAAERQAAERQAAEHPAVEYPAAEHLAAEHLTAGPPAQAPGLAGLRQVIGERSAVLLPGGSAEIAARACADLASLAADLRRIGVDADALVWAPQAERIPPAALAALLREGAAAGLGVLAGTTAPDAAAQLAALTGALVIGRVTDPGVAAGLAPLTGTRLLPPAAAAAAATGADQQAGLPAANLVPCPVVPARMLLALGPGEFVLAVSAPRPRLIQRARLVLARLPRAGQPGTCPPGARRPGPAGAPGAAARARA